MREPRPKSKRVRGVDGQAYGEAIDAEISELVDGCFGSGSGIKTLAYLESLTTRRILGPEASDQELRHLEGARWVVGVIRHRMAQHKAREAANGRSSTSSE